MWQLNSKGKSSLLTKSKSKRKKERKRKRKSEKKKIKEEIKRKEAKRGEIYKPATNSKGAGMHSKLVNKHSWFGLHAISLLVLHLYTLTWGHKYCSVHHYIPVCPPIPSLPFSFLRVHSFRYLLTYVGMLKIV